MKNAIHHLSILLLFATLLTTGCSTNNIEINTDDGGNNGGDSGGNTPNMSLVLFTASVEGRNMTKSMTPISKDTHAKIYVFNDENSSTPVEVGNYISQSSGHLLGIDSYKMLLTNGSYYFYGISTNTSSNPPTFIDGLSEPLSNGVDYIWFNLPSYTVNAPQVNIPLLFEHRATQVVIEFTAGDGITLDLLQSAYILAPKSGEKMILSSGVIPPATQYDPTFHPEMGISGFIAQYIMLPLKTEKPMDLTFEFLVNGESTPRTYQVNIPVPDGELKAGNSYKFNAVVQANTIIFPDAEVKNWVDVDQTGKPLYPGEI